MSLGVVRVTPVDIRVRDLGNFGDVDTTSIGWGTTLALRDTKLYRPNAMNSLVFHKSGVTQSSAYIN